MFYELPDELFEGVGLTSALALCLATAEVIFLLGPSKVTPIFFRSSSVILNNCCKSTLLSWKTDMYFSTPAWLRNDLRSLGVTVCESFCCIILSANFAGPSKTLWVGVEGGIDILLLLKNRNIRSWPYLAATEWTFSPKIVVYETSYLTIKFNLLLYLIDNKPHLLQNAPNISQLLRNFLELLSLMAYNLWSPQLH